MGTLRWAALAASPSPPRRHGRGCRSPIGQRLRRDWNRQNSTANFAGVLQVGPGATTSIEQTGQPH